MPSIYRRPLIGLALGGGGARGLAHIGVLKVLEEAEIPIDYISGTSMGGIIGAAYASGMSPARLEAEALNYADTGNLIRLVDFAIPNRGLLSRDRVRNYLSNLIPPDLNFSDLHIPLKLAAVDLLNAEVVCLAEGNVLDAVMTTIAVPGVFPAVERDNLRLVDGGILNNVPTDFVHADGAELILAVDVGHRFTGEMPALTTASIPDFARLLPRFAVDFYHAEMIMVNALVASHLQRYRADIHLKPDIPGHVSVFFGFPYAAISMAAGEKAAREAVPALQRRIRPRLRLPRTLPS